MSEKSKQARRDVEVDLGESIAQGNYANLVIISHSPTEFILDFASILPGMPKAKVNNRVVVTPEHAKRLFRSLQDNIARYESSYGPIADLESAIERQQAQDQLSLFEIAPKIGEA